MAVTTIGPIGVTIGPLPKRPVIKNVGSPDAGWSGELHHPIQRRAFRWSFEVIAMLPLLPLAVPAILETLLTTTAVTVAMRLANDAYDAVTKKEDKK